METSIPVVELGDLVAEDASRRDAAAEQLRAAFGQFGLVYVSGHGVDRPLLDRVFDEFLAFTARPEPEKRALARPDLWFQRGWTPPNTEHAAFAGGQPDYKECYFAAPLPCDDESRLRYPELYPENVWPDGADAFRASYLELGLELHEAGRTLLRGCARALGLEEQTFDETIEGAAHVTRALRYLPLEPEQVGRGVLWGEEHTDFNLLTLLPGGRFLDPSGQACARPDATSGLYLRTRPTPEHPKGQLVQGTAPPGCLVAQVGQQLEILTGGAFLATPHVITAPKVAGYSRVSLAHFVHMHTDQVLFPLPVFRSPESVRAYRPPVLVGTYDTKTMVDIGLARPEALNLLGYRHYDRLEAMRAEKS